MADQARKSIAPILHAVDASERGEEEFDAAAATSSLGNLDVAAIAQAGAAGAIAAREQRETEVPSAIEAFVTATNASLDKVTSGICDELDRLQLQVEDLKTALINSGERAKKENLAHLAICKSANDTRRSLESAIVELRATRARLVA